MKAFSSFLYKSVPFVVFALAVTMPIRDNYFKPVLALLAVIFLLLSILDTDFIKQIIKDRIFWLVSGFFLCLLVFGVLLTGDIYNNQKYFFYFYISYLFLFIVGRFLLKERFHREVVYSGLVTAGLIASFQGLAGVRSLKDFRFLAGNMGWHNQLGMFVGAILSGTYMELILSKGIKKWVFIPVFVVMLITLIGSFSRGGWVAFIVVFVLGLLKLLLSIPPKKSIPIVLALVLGIGAGSAVIYKKSDFFKQRVKRLESFNLSGRGDIWKKVVKKVQQRPLGWGIKETQEYNAHNQVLGIALAGGIPSAVYFVVMCVVLLFVFRGNIFSFPGMVVVFMLLHNLVEASLLGIWDNPCLFWLVLGLFASEGSSL